MKNSLRSSMMGGIAASMIAVAPAASYAEASSAGQAPTNAQLRQANLANRQAIVASAIRKQQQIYSSTFAPTAGVVLNIQPRYAGLILCGRSCHSDLGDQ